MMKLRGRGESCFRENFGKMNTLVLETDESFTSIFQMFLRGARAHMIHSSLMWSADRLC
jgi:hypothetical protein